jgi:hypothetical protein
MLFFAFLTHLSLADPKFERRGCKRAPEGVHSRRERGAAEVQDGHCKRNLKLIM